MLLSHFKENTHYQYILKCCRVILISTFLRNHSILPEKKIESYFGVMNIFNFITSENMKKNFFNNFDYNRKRKSLRKLLGIIKFLNKVYEDMIVINSKAESILYQQDLSKKIVMFLKKFHLKYFYE